MNDGPATLIDFVKKTKTCRQYFEYIDENYEKISKDKMHATVGFGFYSNMDGLSQGVPVDIYTMLLCAEKLRQKVLPEGAKVTVVIGDHFAFQRCDDHDKVTTIREKYLKKLDNILKNLGVRKHYEFQKSSDIVQQVEYQKVLEEVLAKAEKIRTFTREGNEALSQNGEAVGLDTWYMVKQDDEDDALGGVKNYFLEQTALFKYLYEKEGCGVKVSWARSPHKRNITNSTSYDEAHFDRFYRELFFDESEKLSFIYTEAGYATNTKAEQSRVIPYTAPKMGGKKRVLLSSKQAIPDEAEIVNQELVSAIKKNVGLLTEIKCEIEMLNGYSDDFHKNLLLLKEISRKPVFKESKSDDFEHNKTLKVE